VPITDGGPDPQFIGPGDYHLKPLSPYIDAGVNSGLTDDYDGNPRPFDAVQYEERGDGSNYDMGAYENPNIVLETPTPTPTPIFSPRWDHTSVVFDNKMWVIAGYDDAPEINLRDVWSSSDGQAWTLVKAEAAFGPRLDHTTVVFNNKMWVIGGLV